MKVKKDFLCFKSETKRKSYKIGVFNERDVLKFSKKIAEKMLQRPDEDFDCMSDDELIQTELAKKQRELTEVVKKWRRKSKR